MLRVASFAATLLVVGVARASPCTDAFAAASEASQSGHLVAAREALIACAGTSCPSAMRPMCVADLARLEARMPTIVLAVTDAQGADVVDAAVTIDGVVAPTALSGKAIPLDPGKHTIEVVRAGSSKQEVVVAREGEQGRVVRLTLPAAIGAQPVRTHRPIPASVWVTSALTVVAGGLWIGFGTTGLVQKGQLDACKGSCTAAAVSSATTAFNVADVAGAVTLVGLVVDVVLVLTRPVVVVPTASANAFGVVARVVF